MKKEKLTGKYYINHYISYNGNISSMKVYLGRYKGYTVKAVVGGGMWEIFYRDKQVDQKYTRDEAIEYIDMVTKEE